MQEDDSVSGDLTRADKKRVRQLADLAWERELRIELRQIGEAIQEMERGSLSPFEVNDRIHRFHDGPSRDLYKKYSGSLPWQGVCCAYYERILADDDLIVASDELRNSLREFAASFAKFAAEEEAH